MREHWPFAAITLLAVALFLVRLSAPHNLLDHDQERPATYVLDVIKNGNWLCQRDLFGDITSKPPLYTWLCALASLVCGRVNVFTLYLPGALAAWGTAILAYCIGRGHFGTRSACFGALACMLTPAGLKEFGLARTDGVFAFTVTLTAWLAFRGWTTGQGWTWAWLAAAAATLTKGPLGVVLAGGGLLAVWWESRKGQRLALRGSHWVGIGLFLLLTAGWLWLSYRQFGPPVIEKLIGRELVDHAVSSRRNHAPGTLFYKPPLYYLGRAAPWSLLACFGLWRIWRKPSPEDHVRRFERFLFCWFSTGLILFALAPHQRGDHLWPIMPAGALIAGREIARLTAQRTPMFLVKAVAIFMILCLVGFWILYHQIRIRRPEVQQTAAIRRLAANIESRLGREPALTFVDAPAALQVYLNLFRPPVSPERAAALLRGPETVFVAVNDLARLESARQKGDPAFFVLSEGSDGGKTGTRIVSNRPAWVPQDGLAFSYGTLQVRLRGMRLLLVSEHLLRLQAEDGANGVQIINESPAPRSLRVMVKWDGRTSKEHRVLGGYESWSVPETK